MAHVVFHPMQWGGQPTVPCGRVQLNMPGQNECRMTITDYPLNPSTLSKLPVFVEGRGQYTIHPSLNSAAPGSSRGDEGSNIGPLLTSNTSPDSARRLRLSARKKESRRRLYNYRKEVRKCLEEARPIRVRCDTNEIGEICGLKAKFEDAVKGVAYSILDLNARSFACHSRKNIKFVDEEARKQFEFYPYPLREGYTEKYLREHLKQLRNKWKSWWLAYGDSSTPHDCPDDVWRNWIRYWKTPAAQEESMKGKERRSKARTPSKTGRRRSSDAYDEEVISLIGVGYAVLKTYVKDARINMCSCGCRERMHLFPKRGRMRRAAQEVPATQRYDNSHPPTPFADSSCKYVWNC